MVNYLTAGVTPIASANELAAMVKKKIPTAQIRFDPDPDLVNVIDKLFLPIDDRFAREEWNWKPQYDQKQLIDDFLREMKLHPNRYA
jgi:nucleoside-diphosphate-sugar epimerase